MRQPSDRLHSQGLYIAHLAQRVAALESSTPPPALAYRLFSRRLQSALAGYPDALAARLGAGLPCVLHALSQRHFDMHGSFTDAGALQAREAAWRLFRQLGCTLHR